MDIKSLVIGFLSAACLFLLMGNTPVRFASQPGMYQVAAGDDMVVILDTQTGQARVVRGDTVRVIQFAK